GSGLRAGGNRVLPRSRRRAPAVRDPAAPRADRATLGGRGDLGDRAPAQPSRSNLPPEPPLLHGRGGGRRRSRLVVRRRLRPDAVLRLPRGLRALAPRRARSLRAIRCCGLPPIQEGVRRVLLPPSPRRAPR